MLFVIDTSCLIVLQRLDWLEEFLSHDDDTFLCPPGVAQELRNNTKLLKRLKQGMVGITNVDRPIAMTSISATDAEVIALALECGGNILSEDTELRKKAGNMGIPAINIAGLIASSYQYGRFDQNECLERLKILVSKRFLSQANYRKIVRSVKI